MEKHPDFKNLHIVSHPLVQHKLTRMRDKNTPTGEFRRLLKEISLLMGYELTRHLDMTTRSIETPMQKMDAPTLAGTLPVIVPILRAGLGMAEGLMELIPDCHIGHVGVYRDEKTHLPHEYLVRLPKPEGRLFIVTDPMIATGHSSEYAFKVMEERGVQRDHIRLMALVAAPEGIRVIEKSYPEVPIFVASLDEKLNENAFIVPGLGDAGDRLFGTL